MTQKKSKKWGVIISLCLITILFIVFFVSRLNSDSSLDNSKYYSVKVADSSKSIKFKNYQGTGYYQYLSNNSFRYGTVLQRSSVNLYFLANSIKGSSMKWLNDDHTKVQFIINGKVYEFTDSSYYYYVNDTKKSLSTLYYTNTEPKVGKSGGIINATYQKIHDLIVKSDFNLVYFNRRCIDDGLHNKSVSIKDRKFHIEYMNVPFTFLLQEGFTAEYNDSGLVQGESIILLEKTKTNTPKFTFTNTNKISSKNLLNIKYTKQFNSLPTSIREIAVANYKKTFDTKFTEYKYQYDSPFQTVFSGESWTTSKKVSLLKDSTVKYYGDKTTYHGVDVSIVCEAGFTIDSYFDTLGLPTDFAKHLDKTVLSYSDWYEFNEKMTYSFTSSNGNTYKYVIGRLEGISDERNNSVINILVPNHPAMVGEHFMGGYYITTLATDTYHYYFSPLGYREDFNLEYQIPNDIRKKIGMSELDNNVSTWDEWINAYNNDRNKLIPTLRKFK